MCLINNSDTLLEKLDAETHFPLQFFKCKRKENCLSMQQREKALHKKEILHLAPECSTGIFALEIMKLGLQGTEGKSRPQTPHCECFLKGKGQACKDLKCNKSDNSSNCNYPHKALPLHGRDHSKGPLGMGQPLCLLTNLFVC